MHLNKRRRFFSIILCTFALCLMLIALCACTGAQNSANTNQQTNATQETANQEAAGLEEITEDDLNNAYYLLATAIPQESSMQSLYIVGDGENKTIRGTFTTMADETANMSDIAQETEALLKTYSDKVLEAAKERTQKAGDEAATNKWQDLINEEANAQDDGILYDTYKIVAVVKNEKGTLGIDGEREAGANSKYVWQ